MKAETILNLLSIRHSKDVFVSECKDGPTWGTTHSRMDAIAILRSWTNPTIFGYEIKISRSDFLQDKKWPNYLPYCNEFYFVTPWKMIDEKELPKGVGLIYANKKGSRLYTRKRALQRQIDEPSSMFRYILYSRAQIVSSNEMYYPNYNSLDYWKTWLNVKNQRISVGAKVSAKIKTEVCELISKTYKQMREIERLKAMLTSKDNE